MTKHLMLGIAALALSAGLANAQDLKFAPGSDGDKFDWQSYDQFKSDTDLSGETLTITGPWTGNDKALFESVLAYFEAATGAKVNYSGSESFEQDIVIAAKAGTPPNIAVFPQPGLASDMARQGYLTPMPDGTGDWIKNNYAAGKSWEDLSTYKNKDGEAQTFTFPFKADLKSLVWYVPENFKEAGYKVPETMEDLKALTEQIKADGGTPWCIGLGSGAATGWPATDWVEDIMLRTQSPETYDDWVTNKLKFNDPKVVEAIKDYGWFAKTPGFAEGGEQAVATTDFRDSPKGLFDFPPKCYMHKQASFIPTFFPEGTKVGQDVNFFYFPAYADKNLGKPVLGAGTMFGITKDSKAAEAFIKFLETPIASEIWMAQSGFLTPNKNVNPAAFANDVQRHMNSILLDATTFRFDGSDQMPGEIGTDAFWKAMVAYTTGDETAQEAADAVQKRWDSIQK
ncbi:MULTISPECIES: ABC transporter substrate-binding protein [Thioclava]|uniref:ABC transporter substrate-binding protein n=1 Tax=Thioclava TaxID=285107 RepID=UPI000B539B66|nr:MULTISPECIES: ABC transporter substrate-binding protein [Thioclava]OWY18397.1 alpha-glucoside ABC transporter substrate-binding protein [Thioclava sp. JM3]WGT50221.1 ABC transporter substrate-binding protein [Thioclava nitratireducens]